MEFGFFTSGVLMYMAEQSANKVRASNNERTIVVNHLNDAYADGRLNLDEATDRIAQVHDTVYREDLYALIQDLPTKRETVVPLPASPLPPESPARTSRVDWFVSLFGDIKRQGVWRSPERSLFITLFGDAKLDYRQASHSERVSTVTHIALFGDMNVTVPAGIRVISRNFMIFGDREGGNIETDDPDAQTIVVRNFAIFGDAKIRTGE
jgi:hypothetical protein